MFCTAPWTSWSSKRLSPWAHCTVKFYAMTRRGQQQLHAQEVEWQRATSIVAKFFKLSKEMP